WMSQFLDCFSEKEIVQILKNVEQASDKNTFIYIMEPFIDNQNFPAAKHSLVATSVYFTIIANGNSKMYSVDVMKNLVQQAGLKVVEEFPLIGNSYHTILKCMKG
ncbi:MAG: SAM-dependent methyltransferase, partial [Flavobacteriales bacterium CG_4_10_14_0_2_um_filter_32_8]